MENNRMHSIKKEVEEHGFAIIPGVFDHASITALLEDIANASDDNGSSQNNNIFRKTKDLFAIRRFLFEIPGIREKVFTPALRTILHHLFADQYFSSKSIYFDKPGSSNWFVSYHQDLTISVDKKEELPGFGPWTIKPGQFAVQPPVQILQNSYTIRIHLDDTDKNNGALRVLRGSHRDGIRRVDLLDQENADEAICEVPAGGVMIMKPLIFHASSRTVDERQRRVIHLEFCDQELPGSLEWAERLPV